MSHLFRNSHSKGLLKNTFFIYSFFIFSTNYVVAQDEDVSKYFDGGLCFGNNVINVQLLTLGNAEAGIAFEKRYAFFDAASTTDAGIGFQVASYNKVLVFNKFISFQAYESGGSYFHIGNEKMLPNLPRVT